MQVCDTWSKDIGEEVREENQSVVKDSQDEDLDSDDSVTEFERHIRELMPSLKEDNDPVLLKQAKGTKKSERQKKPSTKWTKDAGFVAEPPKSIKKKLAQVGTVEGTFSNHCLFLIGLICKF